MCNKKLMLLELNIANSFVEEGEVLILKSDIKEAVLSLITALTIYIRYNDISNIYKIQRLLHEVQGDNDSHELIADAYYQLGMYYLLIEKYDKAEIVFVYSKKEYAISNNETGKELAFRKICESTHLKISQLSDLAGEMKDFSREQL
jgi:tetratricopeptide (TPR) repeat protein